jgi:hypothetical protein
MLYRVHLTTDQLYHIMLYRVHLTTDKLYHIMLYRIHLNTDKLYSIQHYVIKLVSVEVYLIQHYVIKLVSGFIIYYQINRCKAFSQQFYTRFRCDLTYGWFGWVMVFNTTIFQLYRGGQFYLAEETRVPRENHRPVASHWQTLLHKVVSSTPKVDAESHSSTIT